jgi:hypothetical protein
MSLKLLVPGALCIAVVSAVSISYARWTLNTSNAQDLPQSTSSTSAIVGPQSNNLLLQPEAVKLSLRVRKNGFDPRSPRTVVVDGVLTNASGRSNVEIRRYQTDKGEHVEVAVAGASAPLSWDASAGAWTSAGTINLNDRAVLERFTFDGADQFILAQLRGASYYVVARNVRPNDAPENYSGPVWNVVRIDDPEQDEQKQPLSRWRLYYLNSTTGLIDKIACEFQGASIEANLSEWTEHEGEKLPSSITWTSGGQTLATFNLTNVSYIAQ